MFIIYIFVLMVLDNRVTVYGSDVFRPRLSMEDVNGGLLVDVYSSNESLATNGGLSFSEKAMVFLNNPLVIPNTKYLYSSRLTSLKDPLLKRCVRDLMFLNPNIGDVGIGKMATWIVRYFVGNDENDNKALSYEELLPTVARFCGEYGGGDVDIIETNRVILYKRNSLLSGNDKRWYSNHYRGKRVSSLFADLIHEGAIIASSRVYKDLIIGKPTVLKYTDKLKTIRTLNKYIAPRTLLLLEDENTTRHFKTQASLDKYLDFVEMYDGKKSLDRYTHALGISKSTAVEFKNLLLNQKKIEGYEK
jgi:hypothetical protein